MKWKKLGKIFTPQDYTLPINCFEYAQSPQVISFDSFNRIYFSTREKDLQGKYLSHISFVDFDKSFKKIQNVATHTIIPLGKLGSYDEHGIFPLNVLRDGDRILGYIGGWNRRVSVSVETSIGVAISKDNGQTFSRIGDGPVITSSLHEPFLVGDPFVKKNKNVYHMWYIFGLKWITHPLETKPQRVYKIAHANSIDGVSWQKTGRQIISDKLNEDECQALPTVGFFNDKYHMFFCYREATGFRDDKNRSYRIGYAHSSDLISWIREDDKVGIDCSEGSWDSDMLCYPHVFIQGDMIYLLYNGNEFGRHGFGLAVLDEY